MQSAELRQKFLDFFVRRGHTVIPSASLVPSDATVLFNTAGMQPLVPFLLGEIHPEGKRLVNYQKCLRTDDIDEVGDDTHLTFFEMLGNWSLGDYWKTESIGWSYEFLTKELHIPIERIAVSCFAGDENAPRDEESADIWKSLGIPQERIAFLQKKDNWWGPVGASGPCGPDTEIFYWKLNDVPVPVQFDPHDKNWVEIWNNVFMQYVKTQDGKYVLAEQKNVDTGMGFERIVALLNGKKNVYETDLFADIIKKIPADLGEHKRRIVADHVRAAVFLISDGVRPSNKQQGYILRRLIRRTVAYEFQAGLSFLDEVLRAAVSQYQEYYPLSLGVVSEEFDAEKNKFLETLQKGMQEFAKLPVLHAQTAFFLYQSFGLPFDIIKELDSGKTQHLRYADFEQELKKHQALSRTASAGMFKGGLADHDPKTVRLHTAHHLLLAALQQLFGKQVKQRGSNINQERLRIDFSFDRKLTNEEKKQIEDLVNEKIQQGLAVVRREMPKEEAEKIGAEMEFGVKYGNRVSVYFIGDTEGNVFSKEFCGGPHVANTAELGHFKILREEAVSAGVRRIKAILEPVSK